MPNPILTATQSAPNSQSPFELWTGGEIPTRFAIPQLEGVRFEVIKRYEPARDGFRFLHGLAIIHHDGRWIVSFGHNRGGENTATEMANSLVSDDNGHTWGEVITIDAPEDDLAVTHGVFLQQNEVLWAFMGAFSGDIANGCHTRAYRWSDSDNTWTFSGIVANGGFLPAQAPFRLASGDWIMAGTSVISAPEKQGWRSSPPAVAISRGDDFHSWDVVPIPDSHAVWGECSLLADKDELLLISRGTWGDKNLAYVSLSYDDGRTWSELVEANLPMVLSKPYAGTLSTGQRYLISSICADVSSRQPLSIAVSRPGERTFSKLLKIRDSVQDGPGESHPHALLAYPYAIEHEGHLWVVYSNDGGGQGRTGEWRDIWNNNSAELAVIPIDALRVD